MDTVEVVDGVLVWTRPGVGVWLQALTGRGQLEQVNGPGRRMVIARLMPELRERSRPLLVGPLGPSLLDLPELDPNLRCHRYINLAGRLRAALAGRRATLEETHATLSGRPDVYVWLRRTQVAMYAGGA